MICKFKITNKDVRAHPANVFGALNEFFWDSDERPAVEQIHDRYSYGGGWSPLEGFELAGDWKKPGEVSIIYPGDSPLQEIGRTQLREETIILFECEWLCIVQPNGDFEVSRVS